MATDISDITEKTWFTRYPLPQRIVFDCGTEFMAEFANMCQNDYSLKRKPITTSNLQYNTRLVEILVKHKKKSKHKLEFMGPFPITQINDNGTVLFQKGIIKDATNIRRIKPFFD